MSLERIEITPFAVIVGDLLQERRTGYLTIIRPPLRKVLYWSQGELVLITSSAPEDSLGDFLVRRGILTADRASQMLTEDPTNAVARFHEAGLLELAWRQTLLPVIGSNASRCDVTLPEGGGTSFIVPPSHGLPGVICCLRPVNSPHHSMPML